MDQICAHHFNDEKLCMIRDKVLKSEAKLASLDLEGVLRINGCIYAHKTGD